MGTITLLLGMMIVVANLRISGFFALVNAWVVRRVHRPLLLLAAIVAVSGAFSAFLVNDAICLVMAPLVLELTLGLGRNPVPYLLAVAMASNVGSTATITGNPQNMMIGSFSQIPYTAVRRGAGAGGADRAAADRRAAGPAASRRPARWRACECALPRLRINRVLVIALPAGDRAGGRAVLRRTAAGKGGDHRRCAAAADAADEERAGLCRDRLVAAADVRRAVHHRGRRRTRAADATGRRRGRPAAPRHSAGAERRHRSPVEPGQQRPRRAAAEAVRRRAAGSRSRLAGRSPWPRRWPAISPCWARSPT